jgi:hypothetical protein
MTLSMRRGYGSMIRISREYTKTIAICAVVAARWRYIPLRETTRQYVDDAAVAAKVKSAEGTLTEWH